MAKKNKPSSTPSSTAADSSAPPSSVSLTIDELAADVANPREIDQEAAEGLGNSLEAFGDLGGITFNTRTGELVSGHQRVEQLRALHGDVTIETMASIAESCPHAPAMFIVAGDERFPVRVVDWSPEKQRAANLAANNPRLQGKFTKQLETYLAEVKSELDAEELWADVGLDLLISQGVQLAPAEEWTVVVDCESEGDQAKLYEELCGRGFEVKLVTM